MLEEVARVVDEAAILRAAALKEADEKAMRNLKKAARAEELNFTKLSKPIKQVGKATAMKEQVAAVISTFKNVAGVK